MTEKPLTGPAMSETPHCACPHPDATTCADWRRHAAFVVARDGSTAGTMPLLVPHAKARSVGLAAGKGSELPELDPRAAPR
jgi:hypothetical protein